MQHRNNVYMDERVTPSSPIARTVPVKLKNGALLQIELSSAAERQLNDKLVSGGDNVFETASSAIQGVCQEIGDAIKAVRPHKFVIEMGFDFTMGANGLTALFVKGDGKTSIKVTMEWVQNNEP